MNGSGMFGRSVISRPESQDFRHRERERRCGREERERIKRILLTRSTLGGPQIRFKLGRLPEAAIRDDVNSKENESSP